MYGTENFEGQEINGLRIEQMIVRRPAPKYSARCVRCNCEQTVGQRELTNGNAVCRNSDCGRQQLREELEETPRRYAQRLKRVEQQKIDALANEVKTTASKIAQLKQQQILKGIDDEFPYDPETREISMSAAEAEAFNSASVKQFLKENPTYYPTQRNLETIHSYLKRHGMDAIVSARQLQLVYQRLDEYSLLDRRPEPEPERTPYVNFTIDRPPAQPKRDYEPEEGWDLRTGEKRLFSAFEIRRMDADTYKRTFRLYGDRAPRTPTHAAF
jgi:hypothetical protein